MWKSQHVALLAVTAMILSVALTLYAQSKIKSAIDEKVGEALGEQKGHKDPIKLMSALSSSKKKKDEDPNFSSIPPKVSFEDLPADQSVVQKRGPPPKGAGTRWTPL